MSLVESLIVVFGVVCGLLVTLLVFLLWKFMNNLKLEKEQKEDHKSDNSKNDFPPYNPVASSQPVGVSWKLIAPQIPTKPFSSKLMEEDTGIRKKDPVPFEHVEIKAVNPTINALQKNKFMSRSLTSLDVLSAERYGERNRRLSHGSDVSDASYKSTQIKRQEKICNQMLDDIRNNDKRRDSSPLLAPRNEGHLSLEDSSPRGNLKQFKQLYGNSLGSEYAASSCGFDSDVPLDDSMSACSNITSKRRRLVLRRGSNLRGSMDYKVVGEVLVSVQYKKQEHLLQVWIHKASGLGGDRRENPDVSSFAKLYIFPPKKQKQKTSVIRGTKDPEFEESFHFSNLQEDMLSGQKLIFKLYNASRVKDELLGEANIFLGSINKEEKEVYHLDLLKKKSKVSSSSLEISLCHHGTYSKLEVIIHQAKNLVRKNNARLNPFVKLSFYKDGVVETKETGHQMNERNPIFNESFDFKASTETSSPLTTYSLVVTLMHHSLLQKDSAIGHVIFTINSPQESAERHLKHVSNEPHLRITEWHKLIDPDDV